MRLDSEIFLYILRSEAGNFYCGISANLERRLKEHNEGKSKATRKSKGWKIIGAWKFASRKEAAKQERKTKKQGVRRWWERNKVRE